jgi:glutamate-1-semialdehyde 2,1-aminomutase
MATMGIGTCLLGYNDPDVTTAVIERVRAGSMCSLNCPQEVELADRLLELHPWAEQARFCRSGGEAMAIAVRLARAATSRSRVAFCGYHGWHDWYLAANLGCRDQLGGHLMADIPAAGVPPELHGTAVSFSYNRADELRKLIQAPGDALAAVIMEPTRSAEPDPGFLPSVRAACDACGAMLVFDEITSGFRFGDGGAHLRYDVDPDVAVFAKAISNGHPMAAVIGQREVMRAAERTFVSSTYWTEAVGPTAALATLEKMARTNTAAHLDRIGGTVRQGLGEAAARHGVPVTVSGHNALLSLHFDHADQAALETLYTALMLEHGILAGTAFYASAAHRDPHLRRFLDAADTVFAELAGAIETGELASRIGGPVRQRGWSNGRPRTKQP